MEDKLFAELMESMGELVEHAKGKRELRTTVLPAAPKPMAGKDVRRLRERTQTSQAVFARCLNVSTQLVQAWESGRRTPQGPALLVLRIAERDPRLILLGIGKEAGKNPRGASSRSKTARKAAHRRMRQRTAA